MGSIRVLILYNEPVLPLDHPDADSEHEILYTVDVVAKTLGEAGFDVCRLGVSHDPSVLLAGLQAQRPDVVFNLFEGTADQGHNEAYVAGILEWLGIPFTGSPFQTLCLARNKHLTKHLLKGAGLPTADFFVVDELPVPDCPLEWPVIVKPATQDASVGLDQGSVVTDQARLAERVASLLKAYGPPVLVEQFIRGREFNMGLIESPTLRVLPVSEVLFVDTDPNFWPIVTYDAKWKPGTRDYESTPPRYPADVTPKLAERLGSLAQDAFRLLGCRDYARVDFRVRPSGKAYILEVNPNPDFSPTAGLAGGLGSANLTHAQFTVDLIHAALARGKRAGREPARPALDVEIRPATTADRAAIAKLASAEDGAWLADWEAAAPRGKPAESAGFQVWVALHGPALVGWIASRRASRTGNTHQVVGLNVLPAQQRRGIGSRLLATLEAEVAAAGGRILLLELSSQPGHIQLRQFLSRHGFRPCGEVPDFYREGDARLTYAKYLAPASVSSVS